MKPVFTTISATALLAAGAGTLQAAEGASLTCRAEHACTMGQSCENFSPDLSRGVEFSITEDGRWLVMGPWETRGTDGTRLEATADLAGNVIYWDYDGFTYMLQLTPGQGFIMMKSAARQFMPGDYPPTLYAGLCEYGKRN